MTRCRGFSLLELAVVAVALSILLAIYLNRLSFYQDAAERARFDADLQTFKTALQIQLANLILEQREADARKLEDENPTILLSEKPTNYAGAYPPAPEPSTWYFDGIRRELVYVPNAPMTLDTQQASSLKPLRFRPKIIYQNVNVAGGSVRGIGGITLAPIANNSASDSSMSEPRKP